MKKYLVTLTAAERDELSRLVAAGTAAARKLAHARILLKADQAEGGPAWTDERIAEAVEVSTDTIGRVRRRFVEGGWGRPSAARGPGSRAGCGRSTGGPRPG